MESDLIDVVVIGAGPAGSIAASIIDKAGFKVSLLEKEQFPRFIIGESLLPHCMEGFEAAGFLDVIKANGFQQKFGAKFIRGNETCDFNFSNQYTKGWDWTWQVKRADFDKTLTDELGKRGISIFFGSKVTAVDFSKEFARVTFVDSDGLSQSIKARFVIDASGYGRVLPRLLKLEKASILDPKMAVFVHITDSHRSRFQEPDRIIILSYQEGVWGWIIPFSDNTSSMGIVGKKEFFNAQGTLEEEIFKNLIAGNAYLKKRFENQTNLFPPRKLEAWSVATEKTFGDRFVLTGNAAEFLDPIFSSGVMFASVSSHLAAQLVIRELRGQEIDWKSDYEDFLKSGIDVFRSYVNAWYDGTLEEIFYTSDRDAEMQKQICSVLAGYVWDQSNPFVTDHATILNRLARMIRFGNRKLLTKLS
ncbi:MAG: NAD(P)/FAD-dependent oxidoreductase [Cyclobacteriaceae bacterium]